MRGREREKHFSAALRRREENYHLVEGYFLDQGVRIPRVDTAPGKIALDSAVAVLDIPKEQLIERAGYIDRQHGRKKIPRLLHRFESNLEEGQKRFSDYYKAHSFALSELASEMACRIAATRLRDERHSREAAESLIFTVREIVRILY